MSGFVLVRRTEDTKEDSIELPTEDDGSLLLSVLQSQFEGASGLKYRNPNTGSWRAIKLNDGVLNPPSPAGWGELTYYVVIGNAAVGGKEGSAITTTETPVNLGYYANPAMAVGYSGGDGAKRLKLDESQAQTTASTGGVPDAQPYGAYPQSQFYATPSQDLIVLGLEYTASTEDLRLYFEKFGEIISAEVKTDPGTGRSRGFGFIRFKDPQLNQRVCEMNHSIKGRKVEVKTPNTPSHPTKLFVGCLPLKPAVEQEELEAHFSEFGKLTDVYIPTPYRGFGFITFQDPNVAQRVLSIQHTLRKSQLNLSLADPKKSKMSGHFPPSYHQQAHAAWYQQHYGQYAQYNQHSAYQPNPQVNTAYGYGEYSPNNQQARANYDRGYYDGRAIAQYTQEQANRSMQQQQVVQATAPYPHPQYAVHQHPQQREGNPLTRPQGPHGIHQHPPEANRAPGAEYQRGIWSNQ